MTPPLLITAYEINAARKLSPMDVSEALGHLTINDCDRIAHFLSEGRIHEAGAALAYGITKYFERNAT